MAGEIGGELARLAELSPAVVPVGWALRKLLGGALDEAGDAVARLAHYRFGNAQKIIGNAAEGVDLDVPGEVHPRVLISVLEEGSTIDDPVMQGYLSGMLRASRTPSGDDDRAVYYMHLIASMTANQTRLHHGVYTAVAGAERPARKQIGVDDLEFCVLAPTESVAAILAVHSDETGQGTVGEAVVGLHREQLVGNYAVGEAEILGEVGVSVDKNSMLVTPSAIGALLFLWGRGVRGSDPDQLGRTPLVALDPPGPVLSDAVVGPFWERPVTQADIQAAPSAAIGLGIAFQ